MKKYILLALLLTACTTNNTIVNPPPTDNWNPIFTNLADSVWTTGTTVKVVGSTNISNYDSFKIGYDYTVNTSGTNSGFFYTTVESSTFLHTQIYRGVRTQRVDTVIVRDTNLSGTIQVNMSILPNDTLSWLTVKNVSVSGK